MRVVPRTSELLRIAALPRRVWQDNAEACAEALTAELKLPEGTMTLRPIQAAALADLLHVQQGGFFPIGVGQGKALISLLAPVVLGAERPLLMVPASLRDQTREHVIPEMRKHWRIPEITIIGYSELSLEKNAKLLDVLKPDVIILDEAHRLKNKSAGRTRRFLRYLRAHPETRIVAMSGTILSRSLKDAGHLAEATLRDGSPLPRTYSDLEDWAKALDPDVPEYDRLGLGALRILGDFKERVGQTPGVVMSDSEQLGVSLIVKDADYRCSKDLEATIERMANTWETPNGWAFEQAADLWRHTRELQLGFYYRWKYPAPKAWLDARREWASFVRDVLAHNRRGLDTDLQVWNDTPDEHPIKAAWLAVRDDFEPETEPEWIDDCAIKFIEAWAEQPGIVWVEHRAVGERLGLPYFGAGDSGILDEDGSRSVAASIGAHGEGKNLQMFDRALVTSPPASGKVWEQMLGRLHRPGQKADEVTYEVMLGHKLLLDGLRKPLAQERFARETTGAARKLLYCSWGIDIPREENTQ